MSFFGPYFLIWDRAFAENVLGPMEWGKWNIIFDQVSQQLAFLERCEDSTLTYSVLLF